MVFISPNEGEGHTFLHVIFHAGPKFKFVSVQWYRTLRDNRLTLVIYSQMTVEVYCSNGHQSGKMAFRFYQHRLYSDSLKSDFHIHDQILICVTALCRQEIMDLIRKMRYYNIA